MQRHVTGTVKQNSSKVGLKPEDAHRIASTDINDVLACQASKPEVLQAFRAAREQVCLIVSSGSSFEVVCDGISLQAVPDSQTKSCIQSSAESVDGGN